MADSLPVNAAAVRAEAAIPVAYLRLFYQRGAVLAEQRARGRTRGAEVLAWTEALDAAYRRRKGPDHAVITEMLGQRRMDWHEEAVVPALAAWVGCAPAEIVMNVTGAVEDIAVELPCRVECGVVVPLPQPPLPAGPQGLHCGWQAMSVPCSRWRTSRTRTRSPRCSLGTRWCQMLRRRPGSAAKFSPGWMVADDCAVLG